MLRFFLLENVSSSSGIQACDSRELQIRKITSTSSSRVPRTDIRTTNPLLAMTGLCRLIFHAFVLFITLLFQLPLQAQDTTNSHIKQLIQTRQLAKAREELKIAMQGNENDPTLNLYQTELWIIEGETYYNGGQYKKALEIYQKAVDRYPSNPMVKMKYQEMIKKVKIAEERPRENTPSTETINEQTINQQSTKQNASEYISLSEMISSKIDKSNLLLGLLCLENFVLIVLVFLMFPKKKE